MSICKVNSEEIRPLRHLVLRKNQSFSSTIYKKDENATTFHLAYFKKREIVTCGTFYPDPTDKIESKNAFRLRGMATNPNTRRMGCGRKLMTQAFKELKNRNCDILWCNARIKAVSFYKKIGFKTKGKVFNIKSIGLHYWMFKKLD